MEKFERLTPFIKLLVFLSVIYAAVRYIFGHFEGGEAVTGSPLIFIILVCAPIVIFIISRKFSASTGLNQPGRFVLLWIVLCSLVFDASLRAGKFVSPFAFHEQRNMHWSAFRSSQWNYEHSPIRLENDIAEIGRHIARDAKVFTDLHTGYYLKAYLPIALVLTKSHHYEGSKIARPSCSSVEPDQFNDFLVQLKHDGVRYIVSNSDPRNINLQNSCIRNPLIEMMKIQQKNNSVTKLVSAGHLELFEI